MSHTFDEKSFCPCIENDWRTEWQRKGVFFSSIFAGKFVRSEKLNRWRWCVVIRLHCRIVLKGSSVESIFVFQLITEKISLRRKCLWDSSTVEVFVSSQYSREIEWRWAVFKREIVWKIKISFWTFAEFICNNNQKLSVLFQMPTECNIHLKKQFVH